MSDVINSSAAANNEGVAFESRQAAAVIDIAELEHGAYYTGRLQAETSIARWHADKRRFVYAEFMIGRHRIRTLEYVAHTQAQAGFCPLARTTPSENRRISEYAFATAH